MTIPPADPKPSETASGTIAPPRPLDGFAPEEFKARRDALRAACPDGLILVRGATEEEVVKPGNYRQNTAFFYLTGVETPGAFLVLLPDGVPATSGMRGVASETREILFLPARNPATETWTGPKLGPGAETEAATGIAKVADGGGFWGALLGWLRRCPVLYTLTPWGEGSRITREYSLLHRILDIAPVTQFRDVAPEIAKLRMVKSAAEIERMQQAIAISAYGQETARAAIASSATQWEYEVEAQVFRAFRERGAHLAFASIIGGGGNGTVLHYEDNQEPLHPGDLVVVDIGARWGHYCGDLTRTYPVGGVFGPRQREIYALVLDAHARTLSGYRPGVDTLQDLTDRCKAFFKDSPFRSTDTAGKEQTMDTFMPHGISHHLGLDVHDVGDRDIPLAPGNVITVEPGLYLPAEGIGVRIEDDYLVTAAGLERLGPPLARDIAEIEALMKPR